MFCCHATRAFKAGCSKSQIISNGFKNRYPGTGRKMSDIPDSIVNQVLGAVDHDALVELTAALVRINSVWDPLAGTSEQLAAECVARWAEAMGFDVAMDQVAPGRPNAIITWRAGVDDAERALMFEGHTDVVTPGDVSAWDYDPFGAEIEGNRMYGRGTCDTKGNLAAMLVAMHALKRSGVKLAGTLVGGVLCDEEDRMIGVLDFIQRGHADHITGAIICEPQDGMICTSQKGAIRARYLITGRMSHGAIPLSGLNSAPALAGLIDGLHELEKDTIRDLGRDHFLGWSSFTPTVVQAPVKGPAQLNVMPGEAVLLVDVRTIPGQSHDMIREQLKTLALQVETQVAQDYAAYDRLLAVQRDRHIDVQVTILTDRPCTRTQPDDPVVRATHWATRTIMSREPVYGGVLGATDGTYLRALKDIPIVTLGAGDREVPHQVNEWVDLDQLSRMAEIYALAALNYLFPDVA